jgi:hypothetical protein
MSVNYTKYYQIFVSSFLYFRPNLTKFEFSVLMVMKVTNTKLRKFPLIGSRVINAENAGRYVDIMKLINACATLHS